MSNVLFQTIDQISREKGIDPQIVIHAIEDAIVVASRKYFKSNEELRGRINPETGEIDVFAVKKVVDTILNPGREITLDEARETKPDAQLEEEMEFKKPTVGLGTGAASFPDGSARNLRRHCSDQEHRAGSGRAHKDRSLIS